MFPKTIAGTRVHREKKRHTEISIIVDELSHYLHSSSDGSKKNNLNVLEFGSGDGFQIPYLKRLGDVVASDIYTSSGIKKLEDIQFVECGITQTPFDSGQFNVIFSNHVIEHIEDFNKAMKELQRIGSSSCIYAFSVPTNIWLLLSLPAQYYTKLRNIAMGVSARLGERASVDKAAKDTPSQAVTVSSSRLGKIKRLVLPEGHGEYLDFPSCYRNFKIKRWERSLVESGFSLLVTKPILLYGPSEWPIIPVLRSKSSFCSSVLFILEKGVKPV